jgi:glycosyltransferase involved in cell wall biosynthesis
MRIGFDTSVLVRPCPPGVVRATRGLVEALEQRTDVEVVRLAPGAGENASTWRQLALPRAVREHGLAGIHSPVSAFAWLGRGARVATIHEVPWARGVSENADVKHRLWARVGPLRADAVVTPSRATAGFVREESPLAAARVHVAPWGVDASFTPGARADDTAVLRRLGLADRPFVLLPGATRAKKNVALALDGLRHVERDVVLAITGPLDAHVLRELAVRDDVAARVRLLGEVDAAALVVLTRHALASALLSHSEGFGFPVVEAQACGTPVIVPDASTQEEIAGGAALVVEPDDPRSFALAVERARTQRVPLAAAGRANAAAYTWSACAERVANVWRAVT